MEMGKSTCYVFQRTEKKYLLSELQYKALLDTIHCFIEPDTYGKYSICNLYFDTDDYTLIRKSIEKPVFKEKLRLRSYGVPENDQKVFLEIKRKVKGVVFKRRVSLHIRLCCVTLRPADAAACAEFGTHITTHGGFCRRCARNLPCVVSLCGIKA